MPQPPPNIDQSLVAAYEQTHYCLPGLKLVVRVGLSCPALEEWLRARSLRGGAFVTAYNPGSAPRSEHENRYWQHTLEAELKQWQRPFLPASHRDPSGQWPIERACFVLGLTPSQALALAGRYQQNAILAYELTIGGKLWWCE